MNGIDVSKHNGNIDWKSVKASCKVDFCIIRAGYGKSISQKDAKFEQNYAGCKAQGIPCGAYWYSYAKTVAEARQEAEVCVSILAGKQFEFPIFFDQEERDILATGKANCSAMVRAFCEVLEKAGYWVGLYTSRSFLATNIEDDIKSRYALWIAEWGSKLNYSGSVGIWQYSEKGHVDGISGNVDLDECYVDYPTVIRAAGKNGFSKPAEVSDTPVEPPAKGSVKVTITIDGKTYNGVMTAVE